MKKAERKRARSEYEKMLLRQDLEAEELKNSSEAALKELQQLQVSGEQSNKHAKLNSEVLEGGAACHKMFYYSFFVAVIITHI